MTDMKKKNTDPSFKQFLKENYVTVLVLLYIFSPIDLIPDILPFGESDDFVLAVIEIFSRWKEYKKSKMLNGPK
ncbi:MAG: YkvA family protein [Patescibacteria group bacterium]|nr:YkvA family protein [Patescibacteria group bacterium]